MEISQDTYDLPLWRTSWRRARRRPFQYILFVVGVAIGVAMMVSIDLANRSATRAFEISTDSIVGRATHQILGAPTGFPEEIYVELRRDLGYELSAPIVEGYVNSPNLGDLPYRLVGIDPFAEAPFRDFFGGASQSEGELTRFLSQPDTVIIAASAAERYGVALGDDIEIDLAGVGRTVQVVGLLESSDGDESAALDGVMFTDISTAQEALGFVGVLSRVDLIVENEVDLDLIQGILPDGTRLETTAASGNAIRQMTAAFELNLTALSLLALVVGMFLIYNTVTFSVVQRRPLFGVLRCLGVTGQQLFRLILSEAIVLSLIGSLIGLVLGIFLGRALVGLITQTITNFYFVVNVRSITIDFWSLGKGVFFGVLAALIASFFPALEALRTTPNASLRRSTLESKVGRFLPYMVIGWGVLLVLGGVLLQITDNLIVSFAGLFAILFAFALVTPPVTMWLLQAAVPLLQSVAGAVGRMAARDIMRSLSRTSVAIAALMTAVSVIIGVSIMIGSFRVTVVSWLNQTLQADIFISPPSLSTSQVSGEIQPDLVAEMAAWPGINGIATARSVRVLAPDFGRDLNLIGVGGDRDVSQGQRTFAWAPDGATQESVRAQFIAGEGVIISEPLVLKEGISYPPAPLVLATAEGEKSYPILAVYYDYASDRGTVWMDDDLYAADWGDRKISTVALFVEEASETEAIVLAMQDAFAGRQDLIVQSNLSLRTNAIEVFDQTFAITNALRLLSIIVAFIGVLSALMSLQLERARELGVLRATGMTIRQLWQLTLVETGLMGLIAGVVAIPTGYALAWVLIYVINIRSFGWSLQMQLDPGYFWQALLVALVAALLAGVYPSYRLGQMAIASALRSE